MLKAKKLLQILIRSLSPEITYKKPQNNYISTRHFSRGRHFILFYSEVYMKNKRERKGEIPVSHGAHHPNSQPRFLFSSPSSPPPLLTSVEVRLRRLPRTNESGTCHGKGATLSLIKLTFPPLTPSPLLTSVEVRLRRLPRTNESGTCHGKGAT